MKVSKIHFPDCSKGFSFVKKYGGIAAAWFGKGVGFVVGWACVAIALAIVFVGTFALKSLLGISMALLDVVITAGRFVKGGIDCLSDAKAGMRQSEISSLDSDGRFWRRSA